MLAEHLKGLGEFAHFLKVALLSRDETLPQQTIRRPLRQFPTPLLARRQHIVTRKKLSKTVPLVKRLCKLPDLTLV